MNQIQTEVIFLNLLRQADEFIFSIVGTNPAGDSGSFRARVSTLLATFQADKAAFVASAVQVGFLATLLKEYAAFRLTPVENIGTPEILVGQIRWEDIYDKPDILAASSDWADITNKPTTFAPSAHGHAYSEITDKPTTFAPSAHGHAYSEITDKPTTFPPAAHGHVVNDISDFPTTFPGQLAVVTYTGNGSTSRVLGHSGNFTGKCVVMQKTDTNGVMLGWLGTNVSEFSLNSLTITAFNAAGAIYRVIIWE